MLNCLLEVKGSGSFVSSHTAAFQFPGLEVKGVGEISYPVNVTQAGELIKMAKKAPFGKGDKTVVDTHVRSAWEIDASELKFNSREWPGFLKKLLAKIKPDLGIEDYNISANLYKMLIYEKGDFFLSHQDSEKEKGMFGTLIIGLPGNHTGGDLLVRFDGKETCVNFAEAAADFKMPYVAFYADCEHEIKPLLSGYRVCLVYNLVQQKAGKNIKLEPLSGYISKVVTLLQQAENNATDTPTIILLGHQYTPENFSMEGLKLNDRSKAEVLLHAAEAAGYYAKMCLVTSYITGIPEPGGGYYGDDVDEDAVMQEVIDESLDIEHWLEEGVPPLRNIKFEEEDLITSFKLDEDEPIVKEVEGYMGNYGPDLMHWYHYGAVMLWPQKDHAAMLLQQDVANKLEWLGYYNRQQTLNDFEINAAETVLLSNLDGGGRSGEKADYSVIVDWLVNRNDEQYFSGAGDHLLQSHFTKIDTSNLSRLADSFPTAFPKTIEKVVAACPEKGVVVHYLSLLNVLSKKFIFLKWAAQQMKVLPGLLLALTDGGKKPEAIIKSKTWQDLLELEKNIPQEAEWVNDMAAIITGSKARNYINNVLVTELITQKQHTPLALKVLEACREDLQHRVDNQPQPPENWSRALPHITAYQKQWTILAAFLQSPTEAVFDYRINQSDRNLMENAIHQVTIDLKTATIKKGSPHTLRITKTQAAYEWQMKEWNDDVLLLGRVKRVAGLCQ